MSASPAERPHHSVGVTPRADESLIGYVFRLARARGTRQALTVYEECGHPQTVTNRVDRAFLVRLAADTRVDVAALEAISNPPDQAATSRFMGKELPTAVFFHRGMSRRRVCPACLEEHSFHRSIWDLLLVSVCPVHLVVLVDTCRSCGAPLRWFGNDLNRCRCGADLRNVKTQGVSREGARATAAAYGLLGDARFSAEAAHVRVLPPFVGLADAHMVDFLYRAGLELLGGRDKVFSVEHPRELAWEADLALTRGLEMAEGWPDPFFALLDAMRGRAPADRASGLRLSCGAVERWLARLPAGSGPAIRDACAEYRRRHALPARIPRPPKPPRKRGRPRRIPEA